MSKTAAMEEADSFAASLIADRSKGALPTIFESRNPFIKLFTQFQVEVNNQLSYLYRDLPRNLKERGKKSLDDYLEFYSAGMKSDAAVDAAETLDAMPEDASTVERYLAIAEMPLSERDKNAALSAIMSDSAYEKYQAARSKGIDTYEYLAFLRAIRDFSGDGKQQRVWDYINSLPLSTAQKDQLHYAAGYKESSLAKTPWH